MIDWFTVGAQIVNFLILMALLKKFLYDRILGVMDEREERIRSRLQEAEEKEQAAKKEAESYRRKQAEIESEREETLRQAKAAAEEQRKELTDQARKDVEALRKRWEESLRQEKDALLRELREGTARQLHAVCRRVLSDLADADLEAQTVAVFLCRLEGMDAEARKRMVQGSEQGTQAVTVRTHFQLSGELRDKVDAAVRRELGEDMDVSYEESPDLILGIEMIAGGERVGWSAAAYLDEIREMALEKLGRE